MQSGGTNQYLEGAGGYLRRAIPGNSGSAGQVLKVAESV